MSVLQRSLNLLTLLVASFLAFNNDIPLANFLLLIVVFTEIVAMSARVHSLKMFDRLTENEPLLHNSISKVGK